MNFGERLRELRIENGLTQLQLAQILGISKSNISKYEAGNVEPNLDIITNVAIQFCVSTDYLLGLSDVKTPLKFAVDDQAAYMLSLFESLPGNYRERVIGYAEALKEQS